MELTVTDPTGTDVAQLGDFTFEMGFGSSENSFDLTPGDGPALSAGCRVYAEGTEYGGVVDSIEVDTSTGATTYHGRSWHGVLAAKVLVPDAGKSHITVSGSAQSALSSLISRMGLGSLFVARAPRTRDFTNLVGTFQLDRFTDGYSGILKMLRASSLKLDMAYVGGMVEMRAEPVRSYGDDVTSDVIDFAMQRDGRPTNHLVCAGTGELEDRAVVHFYADAKGNVSHTQTLFGADEVAALYDYSNADESQLEEDGRKKLQELQGQGSIKVDVPDSAADYDVGDLLSGFDATTGLTVTAEVTRKTVTAGYGTVTYGYECGTVSTSDRSLTGSAETSAGGGISYSAGEGITITNRVIAAVVTQSKLDGVEKRAEAAERSASDAAAAVGGKVGAVDASAPLSATRSAGTVTLGIAAATATTGGAMSASDKAKLDGVDEGANRYSLPACSTSTLGGCRPDGSTITASPDGTLHATVGTAAASFLAAHPVGCIYYAEGGDPTDYGGIWERRPSLGPLAWARTG